MDPSDAIPILILIILVLLSAFFSSAETCMTASNRVKLKSLSDAGRKKAGLVLKILENPGKMLSMVLIGNNLVNISASALMTVFVTKKYGSAAVGIGTGILTFIVLLFGEVIPKTYATNDPEKLAMAYASVLRILTVLFTPLVFILNILASFILRIIGITRDPETALITEEELISYVDVSHEEGVIESEEREMINNVIDFGDAQAKDVMIPRMEMQAVEDNITYSDLMDEFQENKFSRLPVYHESIDNITGIIYLKDICFYHGNKEAFKVTAVARPAHFTYKASLKVNAQDLKNPVVSYQKGDNAVKLNWTAVAGAEKYAVLGFVNDKWRILGTGYGTSYTLEGLTAGEEYRVAVVAMFNGKWNLDDLSNVITVTPNAPVTPKYPVVTVQTAKNAFKLSWDAVEGADKYAIAYYSAGKWKILAQVDGGTTSYTNTKVPSGTYQMVVGARIGGKWDASNINQRAVTVTVK